MYQLQVGQESDSCWAGNSDPQCSTDRWSRVERKMKCVWYVVGQTKVKCRVCEWSVYNLSVVGFLTSFCWSTDKSTDGTFMRCGAIGKESSFVKWFLTVRYLLMISLSTLNSRLQKKGRCSKPRKKISFFHILEVWFLLNKIICRKIMSLRLDGDDVKWVVMTFCESSEWKFKIFRLQLIIGTYFLIPGVLTDRCH